MILAQYTIRSKQEYIFRSNRLLDIVGGTEMIRDAFDWVFAAAEQEGVTCQPADVLFKLQAVQDAFAAGTLGMAELFRGGGNLTVLYRDRDTYLRVNRRFSRLVLENAPGMVPMAACCEANGQNYSADYSALMAAVDAEKNRMLPGRADYAAPFALRDRTTNQPIVCRVPFAGGQRELTAESRKKWEKGQRSDKRNDGNRLLDEMTTEWQEESLLAVIHADGNNMGVKIQQKLNGSIDYDFCVSTMRAFTAEIADAFTRTGETWTMSVPAGGMYDWNLSSEYIAYGPSMADKEGVLKQVGYETANGVSTITYEAMMPGTCTVTLTDRSFAKIAEATVTVTDGSAAPDTPSVNTPSTDNKAAETPAAAGAPSAAAAVSTAPVDTRTAQQREIDEAKANGTWGIEYTTCQKCGYHNWTRKGNVYVCDTCGNETTTVVSAKGVKGYVGSGAIAPVANKAAAPETRYANAKQAQAAADAREAAYAAAVAAFQKQIAANEAAYLAAIAK